MGPHGTRHGGPAIALVCDAPAIGRRLAQDLECLGGNLRSYPAGPATRDALCADPPDLVIAVVMARDPSALCLCQSVGQTEPFAATRLVVLQDTCREIDHRRARALGADASLPLPCDPAQLREAALRLLAEHA
jgi:two-component system OmpR family response regulator